MTTGTVLEPAIAELYRLQTGCRFHGELVLCRSIEHPFMTASIDRVTDDGRIVELKFASRYTAHSIGDDGDSDSLPAAWKIQVQHQIECLGTDLATLAVLHDGVLKIFPVPRDQFLIDSLVAIEEEFWGYVERQEEPPELSASDADMLTELFGCHDGFVTLDDVDQEAADLYQRLGLDIKSLEASRDTAKARLLKSLGEVSTGELPDGRIVKRTRTVVPASVREVKAYTMTRITIKESKAR
jgi:predicted phage-related endonuclease